MSSALLRSRSGSATARLAWTHFGSIRFSHGLLTGNWQTRIRTPPSRLACRLWARTHERTSLLRCQLALWVFGNYRGTPQHLVFSLMCEGFITFQVQPDPPKQVAQIFNLISAALEHLDFVVQSFDPAA